MLRLISETYENSSEPIPPDLSNLKIFDHYWKRKMGDFQHQQQLILDKILACVSELMVYQDKTELQESEVFQHLDSILATSNSYADIIRYGFLIKRTRIDGVTTLAFPFDKLRSYVYTRKARAWQGITSGQGIADELGIIRNTRLGLEVLIFYTRIDPDPVGWLNPLIDYDLSIFLNVMNLIANVDKASPSQTFSSRVLAQYLSTYNAMRNQFPALKMKLAPYTNGEAGLLISGPWCCYRTTTKKYPRLVVILEDSLAGSLFSGKLSATQYNDLQPAYDIVTNKLLSDLSRKNPFYLAKAELTTQIAELVGKQLLDESACPELLSERIYHILNREPSIGILGSPKGIFWEHLHFLSFTEAINTSCSDLSSRCESLRKEWHPLYMNSTGGIKKWYELNLAT